MKQHAENYAPHRGRLYESGARAFIHKGTNGRWRDVLSAEDCRRYEATAQARLGPSCARWLTEGGSLDQGLGPAGSAAVPSSRLRKSAAAARSGGRERARRRSVASALAPEDSSFGN